MSSNPTPAYMHGLLKGSLAVACSEAFFGSVTVSGTLEFKYAKDQHMLLFIQETYQGKENKGDNFEAASFIKTEVNLEEHPFEANNDVYDSMKMENENDTDDGIGGDDTGKNEDDSDYVPRKSQKKRKIRKKKIEVLGEEDLIKYETIEEFLISGKSIYKCPRCDFTSERSKLEEHLDRHNNNKRFSCEKCSLKFIRSYDLKRHTERRHGIHAHSCSDCDFKTEIMKEMKKHKKEVHQQESKTIKCNFCIEVFPNLKALKEHMNAVHQTNTKCPECDEEFNTGLLCYDHIRDGHKLRCPVCEEQFSSNTILNAHVKTHTADRYTCDVCGKKLSTLRTFKLHKLQHTAKPSYKCSLCDKAFFTQNRLKRHTNDTHLERPLCTICSKTFSSKIALEAHRRKHAGIRPFTCSMCGKAFITEGAVRKHEQYNHGDINIQCEKCDKTFKSMSHLKSHQQIHEENRVRSFVCEVCGYATYSEATLKIHLQYRHVEERNFACTTCNKKFKSHITLRNHTKVHDLVKEFHCDEINCGKRFRTPEMLLKHKQKHLVKRVACTECLRTFRTKKDMLRHIESVHMKSQKYKCEMCGKTASRMDNLRTHIKSVHGSAYIGKVTENILYL